MAPAFCLEGNVSNWANTNTSFKQATGQVRLTMRDGTIVGPITLQDALAGDGYIEARGTGDYSAIEFIGRKRVDGRHVQSIEFVDHCALVQDSLRLADADRDAIHAEVGRVMAGVKPNKHDGDAQREIWEGNFGARLATTDTKGVTTIKSIRTDESRSMELLVPALSTHSDTSLFKTPQGKYVLHDAGATSEEIDEILSMVNPDPDGMRRIAILITHPDYDHYKGLSRLLERTMGESADVDVEEIIISIDPDRLVYPHGIDSAPVKPAFRNLLKKLVGSDSSNPIWSVVTKSSLCARFCKDSTGKLRINRRSTWADTRTCVRGLEWNSGEPGLRVRFYIPSAAAEDRLAGESEKRHARNLITRYLNEKTLFSVLDLGDASPTQIRELVNKDARSTDRPSHPRYPDLVSTVVKWPHHAWVPKGADRALMIDFLIAYAPRELVVNAEAKVSDQQLSSIKALVREAIEMASRAGIRLDILVTVTKGHKYLRYVGKLDACTDLDQCAMAHESGFYGLSRG